MPPLEGNEEGKGLKILTPTKPLTRLPNIISTNWSGNNSYKLENEIR